MVLAGGAVLLVMLRSILKRLPEELERSLVLLVGPVTVVGAWYAQGLSADQVPLADLRDDTGAGFYVGLAVIMALAAWLLRELRVGFDAAFTFGVGLVAAAAAWGLWDRVDQGGAFNAVGEQFGVDGFSVVFAGVVAVAVALAALVLDGFLRRERLEGPEMYVLMLLSAMGGAVMAGANDLLVLFLGLETLSIAVYVMAAMHVRRSESTEAGFKYFVLGAFSSAFLLYGIAFVYGATGSTNLVEIRAFLDTTLVGQDAMLLAGFGLLLVGLGFKVAAVPFHAWTPDVYQGAPTPVVAYMASAVKAAGFAALVRVFVTTFGGYQSDWRPAVAVLAILTLLVGAVMALAQNDVKRMLAYSSISHAGFILVGLQAATPEGTAAVVLYAVAYTFLAIGSYSVLSIVSGPGDRGTTLADLDGLSSRRPTLALGFTLLLLAQAGVPFTSGFVAKFEVIVAAVDADAFWLAGIAMVAAVVSAFLYLRVVLAMYLGRPTASVDHTDGDETVDPDVAPERLPVGRAAAVAVAITVAVTIGFGLVPDPLVDLATDAVPQLVASAG
jgi:NADH-quinone oxidoreductase subunit N